MEKDASRPIDSPVDHRISVWLFAAGVLLFIITRVIRLEDFPIYFFCDEAYIGVYARRLLADGFKGPDGLWFPMYWEKASQRFVPQISIYLSLIPSWIFPHSVIALRSVTVVLALIGSIAASLACRDAFRLQYAWWTPVFLMAVMPVYFLHSRLAFETANVISFYLVFIGSYCAYRSGNIRAVWIALVAAFLMFYSHMSGMIVISFTAACLALIHLPWHLKNWRVLLRAAAAAFVLLIPFLVFRIYHPDAMSQQLSALGSSWGGHGDMFRSLNEGLSRYPAAFNFDYWFVPQDIPDQMRHLWKGRGFMSGWMILPFLVGATAVISLIFRPLNQVLLVSFFAGATPVIFVESHIQRIFYIVAPCCYIMAIGIDLVLRWAGRVIPYWILPGVIAAGFTWQGVVMLKEAVVDAPTWYPIYGLGGMQWGARQVFGEAIPRFLRENPEAIIVPSGNWANGADIFPAFFLSDEQQRRVSSPPFDILYPDPGEDIPPSYVFILSRDDQKTFGGSGRFLPFESLLTINDPDGSRGFIFTRLKYVPEIDQVLAPERELRRTPVTEEMEVWGVRASVTYSRPDGGQIRDAFDGDKNTVIRGVRANPFIFDLKFQTPVRGKSIKALFFPMHFRMSAEIWTPASESPIRGEIEGQSDPLQDAAGGTLTFAEAPIEIERIRLEIQDLSSPADKAHVHTRELALE